MPHVEIPQAEFKLVILGDANCGKTSLVTRFAQGYYHPNLNHRSKSAPNSPNNGGHTNAVSSLSPAALAHRNPNFVTKSIPVTASNIPTKIQIWDVDAGSVPNNNTDNNNAASPSAAVTSNKGAITAAKCYYSNASAILLGYDVTSRSSYDGMRSWLNELRSSSSTTTTNKTNNNNSVSFNNVVIAIVALKIDLLDDYPYKGGEVVPEYEVEQLAQTLNVMYIPTSAKLDINVMSLFSRVAEEVLERRKQQREGSVGGGGGIGGYGLNGGTTLTGATTTSTAYEKKGSDANKNNGVNNDGANNDNDHRDDYDDVTDKNGNDEDDGTNQFGKRKRSSSGCAPASAVFGMMGGRGKEEENGGNMDGNNKNDNNMMEEDMDNDDDSLNDGEKKKKDGDDDEEDENTGSFFMMCGNTTWCGNTADTI